MDFENNVNGSIEDLLFAPTICIKKNVATVVTDSKPRFLVVGGEPKGRIRINGSMATILGIANREYLAIVSNIEAIKNAIASKQEVNGKVIKEKDIDKYLKIWVTKGFPMKDETGEIVTKVKKSSKAEKDALMAELGVDKLTKNQLPTETQFIGAKMSSPINKIDGTTGISMNGSEQEYWDLLGGNADTHKVYTIDKNVPIVKNMGIYGDVTLYELTFVTDEAKMKKE